MPFFAVARCVLRHWHLVSLGTLVKHQVAWANGVADKRRATSQSSLKVSRTCRMADARVDTVLQDAPYSVHESPCTGTGVELQDDANDGGQGVLGMLPEDASAAVLAHVSAPALLLCSVASRPLQKMAYGFLSALTELDLSVQGIVQGNDDDMEGLAEILKSQCP